MEQWKLLAFQYSGKLHSQCHGQASTQSTKQRLAGSTTTTTAQNRQTGGKHNDPTWKIYLAGGWSLTFYLELKNIQ